MEEPRPVLPRRIGMTLLGMMICWLFNLVQFGVTFWLFLIFGESFLAAAYTLIGGIGLLQIAYIIPLYRLLRRKNLPDAARGLALAACLTAMITAGFDVIAFRHFHSLPPPPRARIFTIYLARKG
ncbi:MAG TPA: hypothetical protein VE783_07695 [Candidatus Limnocylindrales bacterium]|nr:hypothetical protein [Candidatus Limnocylindrales bacterium]